MGDTTERNIGLLGRFGVDYRRRSGTEVSEAHSETHLKNVASIARLVSNLYGFSEREGQLASTAAWFHDLVRSPSEDPNVKDDAASANVARQTLTAINGRRIFTTSEEEREAIAFAIENHGQYPDWLGDSTTRNRDPETLQDKLWLALFAADKIEANGVRVIARRSSFVAGDRLQRKEGDWQKFGFEPGKDEKLVVAIESILRLTFINPEEIYPKILMPLVHPLYEVQREFVNGICKALNLTTTNLAEMLLEPRTANGQSILVARGIPTSGAIDELRRVIGTSSGITDESIRTVSEDASASASEAVQFFSANYTVNLDKLIETWQPAGMIAQRWKQGMREYQEGVWFKKIAEEVALNTFLREHTPHDESLMPMTMSSPYRVPSYARSKWGIGDIPESDVVQLYSAEWAKGTASQLELVSQASVEAGFGNHPETLRRKTADIVAALLKDHHGEGSIRILDIGAGPGLSGLSTWQALPKELQEQVGMILLDPSNVSLQQAEKIMKENCVKHQIIPGTDLDIPQVIQPGSFDVVTAVASIHHHSEIPWHLYFDALKPGGSMVIGDWHNSLWEHPGRVYAFLQRFDWPKKDEGSQHWLDVYPQAASPVLEPSDPFERRANKEIMDFWLAYFGIVQRNGQLGPNAIWPHEGHRPVIKYIEGLKQAGFSVNTHDINRVIEKGMISANPYQILPQSSLLMVTIAQKPIQ